MFKRKIYKQMLEWKEELGGKTVLLIEGARCVGKITIVESFVQNEYDSYILVDFIQHHRKLKLYLMISLI